VDDSDPASVFVPAAKMLSDLGIAFLELREIGPDGTYGSTDVPKLSPQIRQVFQGPLILNSDFDSREKAQAALDSGVADGSRSAHLPGQSRPARTAAHRCAVEQSDMKTWYSQGPEGYIDYPTLEETARAA
jgi:2,4-dienoyl-CoA reductase-like NADH-dependent reductase (Old Yellow Enzyme family)